MKNSSAIALTAIWLAVLFVAIKIPLFTLAYAWCGVGVALIIFVIFFLRGDDRA